jgi:very-short-patch-repair endonuclease
MIETCMTRIYVRPPGVKSIPPRPPGAESVFSLAKRLKSQDMLAWSGSAIAKEGKKKAGIKRKSRLNSFSRRLNYFMPKSEVWFWTLWMEFGMYSSLEEPNGVFAVKIPDVINRRHMYIIEIDGSIHDQKHVRYNDYRKMARYRKAKYKVWRVRHFDEKALIKVASGVWKRRSFMEDWLRKNPKVARRRPAGRPKPFTGFTSTIHGDIHSL